MYIFYLSIILTLRWSFAFLEAVSFLFGGSCGNFYVLIDVIDLSLGPGRGRGKGRGGIKYHLNTYLTVKRAWLLFSYLTLSEVETLVSHRGRILVAVALLHMQLKQLLLLLLDMD